ncbi:precorrin-6y C5,15-methyltransferase (decarboxylating) subunit CbiE [Desulfogranum marinum]|uniref:precorrin-6y C5,15-methyltransferase (decarboxylating) subunit CbiE n=1 Tax=Desulfogranum marinum TaxID=453220 RepID=UPI0029C81F1F|nr:precorrin-6y C5,15-methyltransferase (decarboxylating) subunit CbiE [Desulfogranum marinum]
MSRIELIGIAGPVLDQQQQVLISGCCAVVASARHQKMLSELTQPIIPIAPIQQMVDEVTQQLHLGSVAILASGDPLFYGIGKTLLSHFDPSQLRIHPALSALQLACARFKISWDDLTLISLHGRAAGDIAGKILGHAKAILFTDNTNTPAFIAQQLLLALEATQDQKRIDGLRMRVAENLGLPDEALYEGDLESISRKKFSPLNMVLVEQKNIPSQTSCFGLNEGDIHHSRGLITKNEVRAASLHKLCLPQQGVFWDIGGGSGSISLEAARLNPDLTVYTIEKKPEEQENIRRNIKEFNTYNMHLVCGEAPQALLELPSPDRIFIGGSGSHLEPIIAHSAPKLAKGGKIVVNAVLQKTAEQAPDCLQRHGLLVETATIAVTRKEKNERQPTIFNPITIITGSS